MSSKSIDELDILAEIHQALLFYQQQCKVIKASSFDCGGHDGEIILTDNNGQDWIIRSRDVEAFDLPPED